MSLEKPNMAKRVQVTIPEEVEDLFTWMVKYDERFKGKEAAVVAHYFSVGIQAAYAQELSDIEPLDKDIFTSVNEHALSTMKKAL